MLNINLKQIPTELSRKASLVAEIMVEMEGEDISEENRKELRADLRLAQRDLDNYMRELSEAVITDWIRRIKE